MVKKYVPKQKDIVFLDFTPTKGHEQDSYRPAIVISNRTFNNNTKMAILCPITTNNKKFPTHYLLKKTKKIKGSVLCEHIRSIDYETRHLKYVDTVDDDEFDRIMYLISACL